MCLIVVDTHRYGGHVVTAARTARDHDESRLKLYARREVEILKRETELSNPQIPRETPAEQPAPPAAMPDPRRVFVVHGRNLAARDAMFAFLRSVNLEPIEWSEAVSFTGEGSPFTGRVLERAFEQARAVVVLITGDDLSRLGTRFQQDSDPKYEKELTPQARPNVLFEAGMAFGTHPERTILVSLGFSRPFSDVAGRNQVRISNLAEDRQALAGRLKTAGCDARTDHKSDWLHSGNFDAAIQAPDSDVHSYGEVRGESLAAIDDITDKEEVEFFNRLRQNLNPNHTYTPAPGSREDLIAERLAKRGWLAVGPVGGYRIQRLI